jgi:hypothetical protein
MQMRKRKSFVLPIAFNIPGIFILILRFLLLFLFLLLLLLPTGSIFFSRATIRYASIVETFPIGPKVCSGN